MTNSNIDLNGMSLDQMLDLKDALDDRLSSVAASEMNALESRLERLKAYLPKPAATKPAVRKPAKAKRAKAKPASAKPAAPKPAAKKPVAVKPAAAKPAAPKATKAKAVPAAPAKKTRKPAAPAKSKLKGRKAPVKFRDPKTGKTWSGRGMTPVWLRDHEAAGRSRDKYAV